MRALLNRSELWFVILATFLALTPFLAKPFHMDDTVFVRIAEQIGRAPAAPYAFDYNWSTRPLPVWALNFNPPLTSYFLAAAFLPFGIEEVAGHAFFLLFALGSAALMFSLARRWCPAPRAAALACVFSPAYLVNATNVMADVPMLFFWLLAVWFVVLADERGEPAWLWAAGAALSCAAMSKYFGFAAVPLAALYWRLKARRWGGHAAAFLLPVATVAAWCLYSYLETGVVHPLMAGRFAAGVERSIPRNAAAVITFLGGGLLWPVWGLSQSLSFSRKVRVGCLAAVAAAWMIIGRETGGAAALHWIAMTLGGCLLFAAAVRGTRAADPETVLLWTWLGGTLFFCVFVNWTVNVRILLPALFPATVLAMRGLDAQRLRWAWVPTLAAALFIAAADYGWAAAVRDHARVQSRSSSGRVYFVGHWGFQYYMEKGGAAALNFRNPGMKPGDRLVVSLNNTSYPLLPAALRGRLGEPRLIEAPNPLRTATTDNFDLRAGFYSDLFGPIPYLAGAARFYDKYRVGEIQ